MSIFVRFRLEKLKLVVVYLSNNIFLKFLHLTVHLSSSKLASMQRLVLNYNHYTQDLQRKTESAHLTQEADQNGIGQTLTCRPGLFSPSLTLPILLMRSRCVDSRRRTISRYRVFVFQSRDTPIARWCPPSTPASKNATGGRAASNNVAVIL